MFNISREKTEMIQQMLSVNWLAILACGVALMVIGFIWYTVFANRWAAYSGWTREKVAALPRNQIMMSYGITFIAGLVMVFVLAGVLHLTKTTTFPRALAIAGIVWAGFTAAPTITNFSFERRPWGMFLLTYVNHLLGLLVSALILTAWR
jgi:hypothetical protein